jgi:hypothetical protein
VAVGASAIASSEFGGAIVTESVIIFSTSEATKHLVYCYTSHIADIAFVAALK